MIQLIVSEDPVKPLLQLRIEHINPRQVHGNRNRLVILLLPPDNLSGRLFPHISVHQADLSALLKKRDEIIRRNHSQLGVVPAHQSLRAHQLRRFGLDVVFRLVIDFKFIVIQRALQVVQESLLIDLPLSRLLIEYNQMLLKMPPRHAARCAGPVEKLPGLGLFLPGHHAHPEPDAGIPGRFVQPSLKTVIDLLIVVRMPAIDIEPVRLESSRDSPVFLRDLADLASKGAQHPVAELSPAQCIDGMELFDVQHDGIHRGVGMLPVHPVGILEEILPVVQPSQVICLCRLNQLLCLFLRPHALDHQGKDQQNESAGHKHHSGQVFRDEIIEGEPCVFCNVPGQCRRDSGRGHEADRLRENRIQLRLTAFDREGILQPDSGCVRGQIVAAAHLRNIVVAEVADQDTIRDAIRNRSQAV